MSSPPPRGGHLAVFLPAVLSNAAVSFLAQGLGIGFLYVCVPISVLHLRGPHVNPWAAAPFSMFSLPSAS